MDVRFFSLEFRDPATSSLLHNAIMTPEELGEYVVRNPQVTMSVVVGPRMETRDCLLMSREERGVAHE